jgi:hypothetical protein
MDEALKAKLDEARQRMNSQQAGIDADRNTRIGQRGSGPEENSGQRMLNGLSSETRWLIGIGVRLKNAYSNFSTTTRHYPRR